MIAHHYLPTIISLDTIVVTADSSIKFADHFLHKNKLDFPPSTASIKQQI